MRSLCASVNCLVDVGEPLGGDVLFVVESPNLILPFVGDACVFGFLNFDL